MMGLWSGLPQFTYTKLVIVVDDDIDARDRRDVMWAVATRSDPGPPEVPHKALEAHQLEE